MEGTVWTIADWSPRLAIGPHAINLFLTAVADPGFPVGGGGGLPTRLRDRI